MNIEKTKAQMRKGLLEMVILSIIEKKEVYASEIIQKLKESDLIVVEGTLYPLLSRLKKDDYLNYRWEESNSGPPRKYYSLTKKGKETSEKLINDWTKLVNSINAIIESEKTA